VSDPASKLSPLALGCFGFGNGFGAIDEQQAQATLDTALDAGWTTLDTAESYMQSEERLGRMLKGRRDQVYLATKAFPCEPYTRENLNAALDGSLRRLGTDYVDLFQLHAPQDWLAPLGPLDPDAVAEALDEIKASGKARNIGVCNLPLAELKALHERTPIFATQNLYSMLDRTGNDTIHLPVEDEILPYSLANGIAVLVWAPLARGLLSDAISRDRTYDADDERKGFPRFQPGIIDHYVTLAEQLRSWAADHGHTLTHLAVAWVLANPAVTSALICARTPAQVEAVVGAEAWNLSPEELTELDQMISSALPAEVQELKAVTLDHVTPEALEMLRARRHDVADRATLT
jgi:aryl-alcohol dehydrogenase-like predicted oxidoreductase